MPGDQATQLVDSLTRTLLRQLAAGEIPADEGFASLLPLVLWMSESEALQPPGGSRIMSRMSDSSD